MAIKRITPPEAANLMEQGWSYIDVRSVPEFEEGHPSGAYNVPVSHKTDRGMVPNPDFVAVMRRRFAGDAGLVLACRTSGRSTRAAQALSASGFENVLIMAGGYAGEADCEGWPAQGLPIATRPEPGRSYAELSAEPEADPPGK